MSGPRAYTEYDENLENVNITYDFKAVSKLLWTSLLIIIIAYYMGLHLYVTE